MRQLFIAVAIATAALALASCDPRPLEVTDNSALKSITLTVNNDTPKWEFGEERIFTIKVSPATAICERFELKASNADIITIRDGELPNQFKATAGGEGKVILTALAVGHGEIAGQAGNDVVECTDVMEFTLVDSRVKPQRPVVTLQMAVITDMGNKKELAEDTPSVLADKDDMVLTVTSDSERATYSMKSLDNEVFNVERTGAQSWMLKTKKPGRDFLKLTVTDALGNAFDYYFLLYSYGHVTMTAEYDPLMAEAGISISEHSYSKLTGQVYMAGTLTGWPWNDVNNKAVKDIPVYNGQVDFTYQEDQAPVVLADTEAIQKEIYAMTAGSGNDKAWFTPHEARLNYIITLSDPYIVIDELLDDNSREETLWWNFWIYGEFQQEGVASVEMPDQVGHDGEILRSAQNDNGGWENGNEYTIPL
ncbi:MAG: hypothetical protein J6M23_07600 [Bacteroidales bacterium]|nr:hypothetical protein [Bacteroidales bacterium]